ncbi:hypothetical protein BKG79_22320 [Mycobacteroides chelonae]|uniref:hypothetical protein n=1 Tax=Mycobacteroides chelonae TaxID=1774 RepID=UPI0008A926C0|nr:hypothetical protein [Mycobacteroides chelonae]OHU33344.1 hypothetical protein BKG79_22320 [Mycobacteroides chelonae]
MSTAAMVLATKDRALAGGASTASIAIYGGLVRTVAHLVGGADASVDVLPDDAVLAAARREVPQQVVEEMAQWVWSSWDELAADAAVLDQLNEVAPDPFPVTPPGAVAYRCAAEQLAYREGEPTAAVAYAGAQAEARFLRLYGGRTLDSLHELAVADVVLEAARRELAAKEKTRITDWVYEQWEAIDEFATESAS